MRILLVDDDRLVRASLVSGLASLGHSVLDADSGEQALAILEEASVDVVISDIEMPGIGGLGLMRELRRGPAAPVCVALTASQMSRDEALAAHHLFDRVLGKPMSLMALEDVIQEMAGRNDA